ncbi:GatB/YqeY domain-containing protein [Micromonospora sp. NPDC048063]|uniref:GatB/YqeY domain-containing protein n=1 Tax=Micromonospora sp. NPDC048063 TaxID=3364256 RepID=UPI00371906DD
MPAPQTDLGHILDEREVVTAIGGPTAELILAADVSQYSGNSPTLVDRPDHLPTDDELRDFRESCDAFLAQSQAKLTASLKDTTPYSCISLAILLGQVTLEHNAVTASPNAFSFEIELISTLESRTNWSSSFLTDDPQATIDALIAARQINIASHLQVMAKGLLDGPASPNNLGLAFRIEWLSGRGRSITAFDLRYLTALKRRMAEHGIEAYDPEPAVSLISPFVERWAKVTDKAMKILGPGSYITQIIRSQSLLPNKPDRLSAAETSALRKLLPALSLTEDQILQTREEPHREQVRYWLQALSLEPGYKRSKNRDINALVDAELKHRPFVRSGSRILLALSHRLATDFSALYDSAIAREHGEKYFAIRAAEVEESSLQAVKLLTPGCRLLSGATYASADRKIQGEVDGVVLWEDVCFVLEGKGGYLSTAARKGSTEAAMADLKQTISEGYFQATRFLRVLDRDGSVTLTEKDSTPVTISAKEVRKAYVLLPTADDLGQLATRLDLLWRTSLLPDKATPLIASIQDLLLMAEVLQTGENFVAYLDFREEVLLNHWIEVIDELEMLGAFVGGVDVVGSGVWGLRQEGVSGDLNAKWNKHTLHIAPVQQERHINPWVALKYGKSFAGNPSISPPSRHGPRGKQVLGRIRTTSRGLESTVRATCLDPDLLIVLLSTSQLSYLKRIDIRKHNGIVAVTYAPSLGLDKARRDHRVKSAAKSARYIVFMEEPLDRSPYITLVEIGPGNASFKSPRANLCIRSNVNTKDGWYERFQDRRNKAFDKATVAGLEAAGVPRDMAIGIDRSGLSKRILAAMKLKGDPARIASLWLSHLKELAIVLEVEPAQLPISDGAVVNLAELIRRKALLPQQVRAVAEELARGRDSLEEIVKRERASKSADTGLINSVIVAVFEANQDVVDQARRGKRKGTNFLMGQILKELQGNAMPDDVLRLLNDALNK